MNLVRLSVRRPVGVTVAVLTLALFGAVALQGLSLDLLPNLELPIAAVITVYPGADPGTVETAVTNPLEDLISTVPGLVRLRSTSAENVSIITAEFSWNADLDDSLKHLERNVAIGARLLPSGVEAPVVLPVDPSQYPVMMVAVSGPGDAAQVTRAVETYVKPRLQQLPGVASVQVLGGTYEEIAVRYDSAQLQQYGITPTLLYQVIAAQNLVVPAGSAIEEGIRYNVRAGQRVTDLESLRNQPVALRELGASPVPGLLAIAQAMPVRLRDVADVDIVPQAREGATRVNGSPAVILRVLKQTGSNSVAVSRSVRAALDEIEADPGLALSFYPLTDQADLIGASLGNLSSSAAIGAALAVAVLLFFLRNLGSIAVIGVAIPLSIAGALVIMRSLGVTLNMMSLGGLAIAVGMLVDNSIVVLENIVRHRRLGKGRIEAAATGGGEIAGAIVASTLTTAVVFVPIFFVDSLAGILFRDTGIAIAASLVVSIVVALTVVPAAAARWLGRSGEGGYGDGARLAPGAGRSDTGASEAPSPDAQAWFEAAAARQPGGETTSSSLEPAFHRRLRAAYARALEAWTARPVLTVITLALALGACLVLPGRLETEFLPATDGGLITVRMQLPAGSSAQETQRQAAEIEASILSLPEVATVATLVGDQGSEDLLARASSLGANEAQLTVVLHPKATRDRSAHEVAQAIAAIPRDPKVRLQIEPDRTLSALGDDFYPGLTVEFSGPDLEVLGEITAAWVELLEGSGGFKNVTSTVRQGAPELYFQVTERSFQGVLGGGEPLTAGQVGLALRNHLTGVTATYLEIDQQRLPVVVRPVPGETASVDSIRAFRVPGAQLTSTGGQPILDRIAQLTETESVAAVEHRDRLRVTIVRAELDGIGFGEAQARAASLLSQLQLPPGYQARITGIHQVIDESVSELGLALLLAVFLVYAAMAAQFESLGQPLVIMVTVPLAASGALAALWATGRALGVPSLIGMVLLTGVAVNNAIVMIDAINRWRASGAHPVKAVHLGAVDRLRPVLMTSITSILGLFPLALSTGDGSELQAPMAVAVMGGLVTSTLLTLFVIPGLLVLTARPGARRTATRHSERLPAGSVTALLIACLLLAGAPVAKASSLQRGARWHVEAMAGAAWLAGDRHSLIGASLSRASGRAYHSVQASGGLDPASPRVISLAAGRYFDPPSSVQLAFRADWWAGGGRQATGSIAWKEAQISRRVALTHARGERLLHPWAGPPAAPEGYQLEVQGHTELSDARALDSSLLLLADHGQRPQWLVTSGSTWRYGGWFSLQAQAGLWLDGSAYHPLARLGTRIYVLPSGVVEITLSPVLTGAPRDWPVLRIDVSQPASRAASRLEWVHGTSGISPKLSLDYALPSTPYAVRLTWSPRSPVQGTLILETAF